jgi:hypothetical protein
MHSLKTTGGVIRHKNIRNEREIDATVDELVERRKKPSGMGRRVRDLGFPDGAL